MSNYELLTVLCNSINKSININGGCCVESHNHLQDKMISLQIEFENLLVEIQEHNENYPNSL